jgi:PIN domain nuclease of toxin-antitoxin system
MRLLLDTSALIWFLAGDSALSRKAKAAIEAQNADVFVSSASGYEIELKRRTGRVMPALPADLGPPLRAFGFRLLQISFEHACAAGRLSPAHNDPWDRILIAQAQLEKLPIATPDPVFASFGCKVLW